MRKNLALFILLSCFSLHIKAQNWGGGIDDEEFNWGFTFQYVASEFKIIKTPNWRAPFKDMEQGGMPITDPLNSISSPLSAGFGIGFVLNRNVNKNADLRFTPSIVFNDRLVDYRYETPSVINTAFSEKQQKVQSTMLDLPLLFKVKSNRQNNFRAYFFGGGKYSMDLASGKKYKDEDFAAIDKFLKNKKAFFSYEAGIGFDLYFEYFKMSPEIKISHSIGNIMKRENTPYATPIEKAILRNFTFSLFFE